MRSLFLNAITPEVAKLCLYYGGCLAAVVVALVVIGCIKRKTKKEMRAETVKNSCIKAKEYAEEVLNSGENKGTHILLGSTKLAYLSNKIADAAWYAFQIAQVKKDILFEGIANGLDALSSELFIESEDGYIPAETYRDYIQKAIDGLNAAIVKLDALITK